MEDYKKKYEDALERARRMCAMPIDKATMEYVFPELKEDNDERIRKAIIAHMHIVKSVNGVDVSDILAWLEKVKDFDKQLELQYKRGYDAAMREITYTEREADAKTIRELQERINELSHKEVNKKSEHDGKKWIDEKVYWKEREELFEDGKQEVINNPMKYGLIKLENHIANASKKVDPKVWTDEDEKNCQKYIEMLGKIDAVEYESYSKIVDWIDSLRLRLS